MKNPLILRNPGIEEIKALHGQQGELISSGYDGVMVWNDAKPDEEKQFAGKPAVIKGRPAGWSEIVVFDPANIYVLRKEINS